MSLEFRVTPQPHTDHDSPSPAPPERGAPSAGVAEDRARLPRGLSGALPWGRRVVQKRKLENILELGQRPGLRVAPSLDAQCVQ